MFEVSLNSNNVKLDRNMEKITNRMSDFTKKMGYFKHLRLIDTLWVTISGCYIKRKVCEIWVSASNFGLLMLLDY